MAVQNRFSRRQFLTAASLAAGGTLLAACQPKVVEVEKVVTQIVKEEVIVEGTPQVIEKVVEVTPPAEKPVEVRYMYWGTEQIEAVNSQVEFYKDLAPTTTLTAQLVPWDQYWDKLWTALAGGDAPDTFWLNMSNFASLVTKDVLMNLQPSLDADEALQADWDANFDSLKAAYVLENDAYSWPRDYDTITLAVNLSLLSEAGLPFPDSANDFAAWDWATCKQYAQAMTKKDGERTTQYGLVTENTSQTGWFNWVYSNGGTVLNEDKTEFTMNEAPAVEALREYVSYRREGMSPGSEALATMGSSDLFVTQRVGMMHIGSWNVGELNDKVTDFEWDAVPIPYAPTGKSICMIHGLGNTIAKGTKVAEAAFAWVAYLGSFAGSGVLGNSDTVIPSRQDTAPLWFNPTFKPEHRSLFLTWTDKSVFFPNTAEPTTAQWNKYITDELTLVLEEGKDVQEAMDSAKASIDAILSGKGI
ncbi:MAG: sugar ABC transporter substrate-binding protein [Anaerolineales bacterium]